MRNFYLEEIAQILGGNILTSNKNRQFQVFTSQVRDEPLPGSLYFLFNGYENEEKLLKQIVEVNAAGIVVKRNNKLNIAMWENHGISIIEVPHMTKPYMELSKIYRTQFDMPFVQVIGSSGKTTTKEMIGAILSEKIPTLISPLNYNSPTSVAYNIFSLRDKHKAAVLEVGMKNFGIMAISSSIIKPDIAVLTSIHRSHLLSLGSIENIIKSKAEILKYLSKDGTLIINGEDENCRRFPANEFKGEILRFGFSKKFDIYATDIQYKDFKTFFKAAGKGFEIDCTTNTVGKYNVANALASILVGIKLRLSPEEIQIGLSKFNVLDGRMKLYKGINNTILIDDNFNANPDSTSLLIQEIPNFSEGHPIILIMGDMERPDDEIKKYAKNVHYTIGQQISKIKPNYLVAIGKWSREYINGACNKGFPKDKTAYFKTVEEAQEQIIDYAIPDSVVLFKASVYTKLQRLIELLKIS